MRNGRLSFAAVALILAISRVVTGQATPPAETYLAAVRVYVASGNPGAAAIGLKGWSRAEFESAINGHIRRNDQGLIEAAALLQLEIGLAVVQLSPAGAMGYFELGQTLLNGCSARHQTHARSSNRFGPKRRSRQMYTSRPGRWRPPLVSAIVRRSQPAVH